ncbi:hypothetical protein QBC44DRAFT_313202 [Cladorrhinum sp. PSN332]|nr:hypothetical protein QBC44DRAFT_313202 [Cladorrhinum sp. PSN332]
MVMNTIHSTPATLYLELTWESGKRIVNIYLATIAAKSVQRFGENNIDYSRLNGYKNALLKALLQPLKVLILLPMLTQPTLISFTVSQPFFIDRLLKNLAKLKINKNGRYGFIGAGVLIY